MKEKIGKKFYSPYFKFNKQMIEVVEYVDDNHWIFKLENGEVYAAKTPLSYFEGKGLKIWDVTEEPNEKRNKSLDANKVPMNNKIEEIILQILRKYGTRDSNGIWHFKQTTWKNKTDKFRDEYIEALVKELSTLIQEERKEAIRGFVDNIGWKKPSEVIDLADDIIDGRSLVKQMEAYLQSLDKGGE